MKDFFTIGPVPVEEDCMQVGNENYTKFSIIECETFIDQIKRQFPNLNETVKLKTKSFVHDFGTYHEVAIWFESDDEESVEDAYKIDNELPNVWDEQSRKKLKERQYPLL